MMGEWDHLLLGYMYAGVLEQMETCSCETEQRETNSEVLRYLDKTF